MASIAQYYGPAGVPLRIEAEAASAASVWTSQRTRLRAWLGALPEDGWEGPTRCVEWTALQLVQHLVSGAQFLGYTLHEASKGRATDLLRGFDTGTTVQSASEMFAMMSPVDLLAALDLVDASVALESDGLEADGWSAIAEAPPGNLPAHLAISHFAFDSWVHEHDLMLPRGEQPHLDADEAVAVASYLMGLAAVCSPDLGLQLDVRLTDVGARIGVDGDGEAVRIVADGAPDGAPVVEGSVGAIVDRATGRDGGEVTGDEAALAKLDRFGALLS